MPFIGVFDRNITFVITRAGDLQPFTTSIGAFAGAATFDQADTDTFATALKNAVLPNLSSGETLVSINFQYNDGPGVLEYVSNQNAVGTGAAISALQPQNVSFLIQKRTALPGKHGRGRMYWPSVAETDVDAVGAVSPGAKTRLQTMLTAWLNAISTATTFDSYAVLHETSTPVSTKITSLSVDPVVATQRRRLRR